MNEVVYRVWLTNAIGVASIAIIAAAGLAFVFYRIRKLLARSGPNNGVKKMASLYPPLCLHRMRGEAFIGNGSNEVFVSPDTIMAWEPIEGGGSLVLFSYSIFGDREMQINESPTQLAQMFLQAIHWAEERNAVAMSSLSSQAKANGIAIAPNIPGLRTPKK